MQVDEKAIERLVASFETKDSMEFSKGTSGRYGYVIKVYDTDPTTAETKFRRAIAKAELVIQELEAGTFRELESAKEVHGLKVETA